MKKIAILLLSLALLLTGLSLISEEADAAEVGPPGTPTGVGGVGYIDVSWTAAPGTPLYYYIYSNVVMGTGPGEGSYMSGSAQGNQLTYQQTHRCEPGTPSPLTPGYSMYFQVSAYYGGSEFQYSAWVGPFTSVGYPGAPTALACSNDAGNVSLSWSAPASLGGGTISNYTIYRSTTSGTEVELATTSGSATSFTDLTVGGGQTYFYKVAAFNGYIGPKSNEGSVTVPPGKPAETQNLVCTPGENSIMLTWDAPGNNGGSVITHYNIYRSTTSGSESLIGSTTDAGLLYEDDTVELGETYYYQVAAVNSNGVGHKCPEISITFATFPSAPLNLQGVMGSGKITLTWEAPVSDGGIPITYYDINRLNESDGLGWVEQFDYVEGGIHSYNDTYVQLGNRYQYSVMACNNVTYPYIDGPKSNTITVNYALAPSEPFTVNLAPGAGTILVSWNAPNSTGGSPIEAYWIFWGTSPGAHTNSASSGLLTSYTITGLARNTTYYIAVAANNSDARGPYSSEVHAQTPTVPGAVEDLMIISDDGQTTLSWTPPSSNGRSGITYYCIYRGISAGSETYLVGNTGANCTWIDRPLINGHTYYYSVHAHNAVGAGSNVTYSIVPATTPGSPTNIHAIGGLFKITVTWNQPVAIGGGILNYQVYRGSTWGDATLHTTVGNVTTYDDTVGMNETWSYWVLGQNWAGVGSRSGQAMATSFSLPNAPAISAVTSGNGYVNLVWSAPSFTGNTPLTGYQVYRSASPGAESLLSDAGLVLSYNDTTAINGNTYYYVLKAVNVVGEGLPSDEVSATLPGLPTAPLDIWVNGGIGQISLQWSAPLYMGGGIQHYLVYRSLDGDERLLDTIGNVTNYVDTTAEIGVVYGYRIAASNLAGEGPLSVQVQESTIYQPNAPWMFTATPELGYVHLAWASSTNDGNSVLLGYRIYRAVDDGSKTLLKEVAAERPRGGSLMSRLLTYDDRAVVNGTNYSYAITSFNVGYESPLSGNATAIPYNTPSAPTGVTVTGGLRNVTISWSAPAHDNGASVTGYWISFQAYAGGETSYIDAGLAMSHLFLGLENATAYSVRVLAYNIAGNGSYSDIISGMTFGPPYAPTISLTSGDGWVNVSWSTPSSDSTVLGYKLYRGIATGELTPYQTLGPLTFFNDSSLVNGLGYIYKVQAISSLGLGEMSGELSATPSAAPTAPTGVIAIRGNSNVSLSWTAPSNDGGSVISGYALYCGSAEGSETYRIAVSGTKFTFDGLTNGLPYFFRVAAVNVRGNGTLSSVATATPATVPGLPADITATPAVGKVALSWSAPLGNGGLTIEGYNVYRGTTAGTMVKIANVTLLKYTDESGVQGIEYWYKVSCSNAEGEGAGISVSATSLYPPPAPTSVNIERSGSSAVIKWDMPVANATSGPVSSFAIYRIDASGNEVLIAMVNDSEARTYTDTTAPDGTANYRVQAVYGDLAGFEASQSTGVTLPAKAAGTDLFLPIAALLAFAAILVLFLVARRRKKEQ
ncbi:MAG TPA: fibronectin type III domain-containing protein [Methanomassiliicoccales archaeon]|jgi:titin